MTSQTSYSLTVISLPQLLARNWWLFLLRGIAAFTFGVLSLAWPESAVFAVTVLFGAYALFDGIFALAAALAGNGESETRWWLVIIGLLGIGIGVAAIAWPGVTALTLVYFFAGFALSTGILEIVGAVKLRKIIADERWLLLHGALSALSGILLFFVPEAGAIALIWLIAVIAIAYGLLMFGFAFKLKKFKDG